MASLFREQVESHNAISVKRTILRPGAWCLPPINLAAELSSGNPDFLPLNFQPSLHAQLFPELENLLSPQHLEYFEPFYIFIFLEIFV